MIARHSKHERGVVLMVALIVLVAMTLAGLAIMRSVDTTNLIAGNIAFKQSALSASDDGIEQAIAWLSANRSALAQTKANAGYISAQPADENPTTWANWVSLPADAAGNTVSYLIHRMCVDQNQLPDNTQCALDTSIAGDPTDVREGDSAVIGAPGYGGDPRIYYRITTRTAGPKNTVTYTQAMVAVEK